MSLSVRPGGVDLSKENKIFILAITFANTESYTYGDDIYNYIIIDSLRTFIIACVDDKMNVIGITDTEELGSYVDIKDNFYFVKKKRRRQIRKAIKNINKEEPDIIMYCAEYDGRFMYIKNDKIYIYSNNKGCGKELNEEVRESNITLIKDMNEMITPESKILEGHSNLFYRYTGHTPKDEVRICPPLQY